MIQNRIDVSSKGERIWYEKKAEDRSKPQRRQEGVGFEISFSSPVSPPSPLCEQGLGYSGAPFRALTVTSLGKTRHFLFSLGRVFETKAREGAPV